MRSKQTITPLNKALAQLEHQLKTWARWYLLIAESGLGYAQVPWDEMIKMGVRIRRTGSFELPQNETAERIEAALSQMRVLAPELAKVLHVYYLETGKGKEKAHALGLCYASFKAHLHAARVWLIAWLKATEMSKATS